MPIINSSDPSLTRSSTTPTIARTAPPTVSTSGTATSSGSTIARGITPIVSGSDVTYPQATEATSNNSVTITSSVNNDSGDVVTVYTSPSTITVSAINQTVNQYTSVDSGVSQIVAGNGVTISSSGASGTGIVTINAASASFGNIAVLNLDGNASNVLHGDGTWSADTTTYGNSNVVSLLDSFGSNTITTTGNVSVGNIIATNIGNISAIDLTGSASNVLYGNGVFAPASAGSTGNILFDQSLIYSDQSNAFVNLDGGGLGALALGTNDVSNVQITVDAEGANYNWVFTSLGYATKPNDVVENTTASVTCTAGAPTVIYTATNSGRSTIKLLLQVEGPETLGAQWDTQSCEMVVARGLRNSTVVGSVYGLAYTSVAPLATFNAIWNIATSRIEITCTPSSTFDVEARVQVIEMTTSA
jgi:hypothetical protein